MNLDPKAGCRVLVLNRVVVGKMFRTKLNSKHLTQPPPGYDSVVGEPGVHLNYEETVVYTNDAIRPAYLVVYSFKPDFQLKTFLKGMFRLPLA